MLHLVEVQLEVPHALEANNFFFLFRPQSRPTATGKFIFSLRLRNFDQYRIKDFLEYVYNINKILNCFHYAVFLQFKFCQLLTVFFIATSKSFR